jgi:hypothetical protein
MKYAEIVQKEKNIFYLCGNQKRQASQQKKRMDMKNALHERYQAPDAECIMMDMERQFLQASPGGQGGNSGGQGGAGGETPGVPDGGEI